MSQYRKNNLWKSIGMGVLAWTIIVLSVYTATAQNQTLTNEDLEQIEDAVRNQVITGNEMELLLEQYCTGNINFTPPSYTSPFLDTNGSLDPIFQKLIEGAMSNTVDSEFEDVQLWLKNTLLPQTEELNRLKTGASDARGQAQIAKEQLMLAQDNCQYQLNVTKLETKIARDESNSWRLASIGLTLVLLLVMWISGFIKSVYKAITKRG